MVFSLTHWKCFQMNIMIVLWRLQRDTASCDKKTVSGSCTMSDWQILLITQCAPCSVWCRLALVAKEVSGRRKHQGEEVVKPLQILCLGVSRNGSNRRTWLWQSATSSATEPLAGTEMEGHLPGHGGGLPWLGMTGTGREGDRAGCLQSYKPLLWLDSFTLTQRDGRAMCCRGAEQYKKALNWVQIFTKA